ncbi:FAD synthase-like isoform X2 [Hetaerina americana]|uniref:FAD synthase-like isoform X2 n=1 Tax=Hetaerina americana TaxID=62018 RepID=UPI003A7F1047
MSPRTAGIIVIGDEILKGMTRDTNSSFMSKKLYSMGIKLKKISVIPDEVDTIAAEISEFSKNYDLVLTSGGIGPTHDDVTYEGVAKAFGEKLKLNQEMAKYILAFYPGGPTVSTNPSLKMANLPTSAKILQGNSAHVFSDPIVVVHNVVIFPGIPQLLEKALSELNPTDLFPTDSSNSSAPASKFHCHKLYYKVNENRLIETLNKAVGLFGKSVSFGCYPVLDKSYETVIVVDSPDELLAARAHLHLKNEMPDGIEVRPLPEEVSDDQIEEKIDYYVVSREVSKRVFQLLENHTTPKSLLEPLNKAIKTVEECFGRYRAGTGAFISFNGGKDCTVLLHLIFALYTKCYPKGPPLTALYIKTIDPFPELEEFVREAALRYNIQLHVQSGPLKEALTRFISEHGDMKAVFIGTRRTDPRSISLQPFQMTDGDWPKIMRVSPLLDWSYENVWTFLRQLSVPYCSLYDKGYTSLGDQKNTFPNPALRWEANDGETKYHPAYMLKDETVERCGRQ